MAQPVETYQRAVCDYEGTSYRANFWEGQGRDYEDLAERHALRRLLPSGGRRVVDVGAGFGRLVDLYDGFEQVVLLDYAKSGLREAQARLGRSSRFVYVAADIYHLPLAPASCDTVVSVRVLHHLVDVPAAFQALASALCPGGTYVLEYANKRNLKAVLRYLLRRQSWSPFAQPPVEFTALNFDFHPAWMETELRRAGFAVTDALAVSHFRHPLFKRLVPPARLAAADRRLQHAGARWKLTPSVFLRAQTAGSGAAKMAGPLFRCPRCAGLDLQEAGETLTCAHCGAKWAMADGIYDFKAPMD